MKRLRMFTLAAVLTVLVCCLFAGKAEAATIERSGKLNTRVSYTLDSDGVLTISGTGTTPDYDVWDDDYAPWLDKEWEDEILKVVVESGVTDIGAEMFYGCHSLKTVILPATVTKIGASAFYSCSSMTSITIPSGVQTISKYAFEFCSSLTSVSLPSTVTTIGAYAFKSAGLTSFTVSTGITEMDPTAFIGCGNITKFSVSSSNPNYSVDTKGVLFNKNKTVLLMAPRGITGTYAIPSTVTTVGESAFESCMQLQGVSISSKVTTIEKEAFYQCPKLTTLTIPGNVKTIGELAFGVCDGLTTVTLNAGVTTIGSKAFYMCYQLSKLTLNSGLTTIGVGAFQKCTALSTVSIPATVWKIGASAFSDTPYYTNLYNSAPEGPLYLGNVLYLVKGTCPETVTVKAGTLGLADNAFYSQWKLKSISLPSTLVCIGDSALASTSITSVTLPSGLKQIGYRAFWCCYDLTSIVIPYSVTEIGADAFGVCESLSYVSLPSGLKAISDDTFQRCTALTSITLPSTLQSIGSGAFEGSAITSITIPNSVQTIGEDAFYNTSLQSISIGSGVKSVGERAFYNKYANPTVYISDLAAWCQIDFGENFSNPMSNGPLYIQNTLTSKLTIPSTVTELKPRVFSGAPVTSVVLHSGITSIGEGTFKNCDGLTSVKIPAGVKTIGANAFSGCDNLSAVSIPYGVQTIGDYAFRYTKISDVTIPWSVTKMGDYVFADCKELKHITLFGGITAIGNYAFYNCTGLTEIELPDSLTSIGNYAFKNCSKLTGITIPKSVTTIGSSAFSGCSELVYATIFGEIKSLASYTFENCGKLTHIVLPQSLTSVSTYVFNNCSKLTQVCYAGTEAQRSSISIGNYGNTSLKNATWVCQAENPVMELHENCTELQQICSHCKRTVWTETKAVATHNWSEGSCTVARTCSICGAVDGEAPGHSGELWFELVPPTCTADGMKARICTVCNETEVQPVAALGHDYTSAVTAPTCTEKGYTTNTCSACGSVTVTDSVEALGHSYEAAVTAPSCTAQGYTTHTCAVCGDTKIDGYTAATGHSFGVWKQTKAPTCTQPGEETRACACGETETQPMAALGHSNTSVVTAPTCTEKGYTTNTCSVCGEVTITDYVDAKGHSFSAWVTTVKPTCTAAGTQMRFCNCGERETQSVAILPHSYQTVVTAPTCTEKGYTTNTCSACGEVTITDYVDAKGHGWSAWIQTAAPSCKAEGTRIRFCNCGIRETETLEKLPHNFVEEVCSACGAKEYDRLKLTGDTAVNLSLNQDLYVDLNGFDLSGTILTNGFRVYGMDSTTDQYTCQSVGFFSCTDENGSPVEPVRYYTEKNGKQYLSVCEEGRYSFHRFFVGITHMSLEPQVVGLGYKTAVFGDEMVMAQLAGTGALSFRVQLEGYNPVYRRFGSSELTSGAPITLRIRNFDVENYSEHNLYAQVSLTLKDGTVIETEQVALTFRWLTQQVNDNHTDYTADQLASFKAMLQTFAIVRKWELPNLMG